MQISLHYSDCDLAARSTFTKHSISILGKTEHPWKNRLIYFDNRARLYSNDCRFAVHNRSVHWFFDDILDQNDYDGEQPLYCTVFVCIRYTNDPRIRSDLRGQGDYRQGWRMENEISAIYEAVAGLLMVTFGLLPVFKVFWCGSKRQQGKVNHGTSSWYRRTVSDHVPENKRIMRWRYGAI